ncbi:type II toxin-antitoxin system HicA family toxin [Nitrosopumilus ureiphilus]|uniref:type II toxin-antitoxin system HicA family toxin n=1 Tax=Nitrosopumilus ureiphilus TaxID=1470067 RepID=UPI0015C8C0D0|nr:type II toxin-antitoxin system HicA family toxin [Nitrosopumilus ureiphilus]
MRLQIESKKPQLARCHKGIKQIRYSVNRQRGSHIILQNKNGNIVPVPRHSPIKESTLKLILEQAEISKDDFLKYI